MMSNSPLTMSASRKINSIADEVGSDLLLKIENG
jgi:hypothetical protein